MAKEEATKGKLHVDVGFWGGIIPGNEKQLKPMLDRGVVGFKCFLCPSGVEEFPSVDKHSVDLAYHELKDTNALIAVGIQSMDFVAISFSFPPFLSIQFHAEICGGSSMSASEMSYFLGDANPLEYETYLKTRPATLELNAIDLIGRISAKYEK